MRAVRAALAEPALRRALVAFLLFSSLTAATWLVVLLYAHDIGGTSAVGAVAVAQLVPATVLAPLVTTWLDRMSVRAALVVAYASTAAATLVVGALLALSAPVVAIVLAAAAQSVVLTMGRPAHFAALPRLADLPSRLVAANAASGTVASLGVLLGPATVAVTVVSWDLAQLVLVLATALGLAAWAVSRIHVPSGVSWTSDDLDEGSWVPEPFLHAATQGLREVRRIPGALTLLVIVGLMWMVQGALDVLGVSFAIDVLSAGEEGAATIAAADGAGLVLGSFAAVVLVAVARLSRVVVAGAVLGGAAMAAVGATTTLALAVVLVALSASARLFVDVAGRTLLHRNADGTVLARVFGVQEAVLSGGMAVGASVAPLFVATVGERLAFVAVGALFGLPALVALPTLRALDRSGVLAAQRISLLRALDLFAPLSPPQLERMALSSDRHTTLVGEVLIEQGDVGDRFYAVEHGRYRVDNDNIEVATLEQGDYFGEIALLRDVPRTASVTCVEPGEVLVLEREPFLVAMSQARPPRRG